MDGTTYLMATKQLSNLRNLERTSNNIANANTSGFKEDKLAFDQYLVKDMDGKTAYGTDVYSYSNYDQGAFNTTYRQLDAGIEGDGFFTILTPDGIRYTRSGNFHLDTDRRLVTAQGHAVVSADGGEIVLDETDIEVTISEDGTISANNAERGVIGVVEFENPRLMTKLGNGLFATDQEPGGMENSRVLQGVLEESNVNSVQQISTLIELNRETAITSNMINENFQLQRSAFKTYSKLNGG